MGLTLWRCGDDLDLVQGYGDICYFIDRPLILRATNVPRCKLLLVGDRGARIVLFFNRKEAVLGPMMVVQSVGVA